MKRKISLLVQIGALIFCVIALITSINQLSPFNLFLEIACIIAIIFNITLSIRGNKKSRL